MIYIWGQNGEKRGVFSEYIRDCYPEYARLGLFTWEAIHSHLINHSEYNSAGYEFYYNEFQEVPDAAISTLLKGIVSK